MKKIILETQLRESKKQQMLRFCKSKKYFRYQDIINTFGINGHTNSIWQIIIREYAERIKHPELDIFCYVWKK